MDMLTFLAPLGILLGLVLLALCLSIVFCLLKVREDFRQMQIYMGQVVRQGENPGLNASTGVCPVCGRRHGR